MTIRSVVHIEARHTTVPEQLALDLADTIRRTGALIHETISACIALGLDSVAELDRVSVLNSEQAVQIVVAGAHNSGVSAVIETFGPRGGPPAIAPIESS
jgi:hypothetical protein